MTTSQQTVLETIRPISWPNLFLIAFHFSLFLLCVLLFLSAPVHAQDTTPPQVVSTYPITDLSLIHI